MEFCAFLPKLVSLRCEDNNITRFNELKVLENCYELRYVHMKGNPIAKMSKYRDHIILNVKKIEQIGLFKIQAQYCKANSDDKDVTRNEINFLRKWNDFRISQSQESLRLQRRHETHTLVDYGHHSTYSDFSNWLNMAERSEAKSSNQKFVTNDRFFKFTFEY